MVQVSLEKINADALAEGGAFVKRCSAAYAQKVKIAAHTLMTPGKKILMLAGPSSAGKTTTAGFLRQALQERGNPVVAVSLDDFYLPHMEDYPLDENGKPDFETVDALDLPLINKCLSQLIERGESILPLFDFERHSRSEKTNPVVLGDDGILIVEGLHALNPVITKSLPATAMAKLYVSVSTRVVDEKGEKLLGRRDLRLLRRTMRDVRFRAFSPAQTFAQWGSVSRGENRYLFPYEVFADMRLDTFHPCEPCLAAGEAKELLLTTQGTEYYEQARHYVDVLSRFVPLKAEQLPPISLLHEFLG